MNFRKASIFQRDTEKPEEQNDSGGMLAVWGSPGSGKTITAVKIAKMLSARKKNVILLLCDMAAPMLPCICPADALESNGSLAGVLAAARISENLIKHNLVTFKRNSCLAVLGLLERQNEYSTPPFTQKQVVELLDGLRQIAPYVIVDCGSYIANDILSAVALMEADSILRLANCDPKSVNYFASQLPLLDGPEWDMDKQYKVASNVKPYQAADHIGKVLGDTAFVLPYSQELEEQYLAGNLPLPQGVRAYHCGGVLKMRKENLSSPSESRGFPKGGPIPLWRRTANEVSRHFPQKMCAPGEVF